MISVADSGPVEKIKEHATRIVSKTPSIEMANKETTIAPPVTLKSWGHLVDLGVVRRPDQAHS